MTSQNFHTIKSILNCPWHNDNKPSLLNFHTIKSILNVRELLPPSVVPWAFPYY